jgi:hypothetical protein
MTEPYEHPLSVKPDAIPRDANGLTDAQNAANLKADAVRDEQPPFNQMQASVLTGLCTRTLWCWERAGLIRPPRNRLGSYCYTPEIIIQAKQLKFLHSGAGTKCLRRRQFHFYRPRIS